MITTASNQTPNKFNSQSPIVSWSAILIGLLLMLAVSLIMNVLGTAVGASAIASRSQMQTFGIGAGIWLILATVVSVAVGAYFAGFCSPSRGELHGILAWAAGMLVTVYLLSAMISSASGATFGALGKGLSLTGESIAEIAPTLISKNKFIKSDINDLKGWLENTFRKIDGNRTDTQSQTNARTDSITLRNSDELIQWFMNIARKAEPTLAENDKDTLVNIIVTGTDQSRASAQRIADEYERAYNKAFEKYDQAKQQITQQLREATSAASKGVSQIAWWTFAMLVLGALAAGVAGHFGYRQQQRS